MLPIWDCAWCHSAQELIIADVLTRLLQKDVGFLGALATRSLNNHGWSQLDGLSLGSRIRLRNVAELTDELEV